LIDAEQAYDDRVLAFIIDQFIDTDVQDIIFAVKDIRGTVWNNFGVGYVETDDGLEDPVGTALERLIELNVVRKVERKIIQEGGAAIGNIGERVMWRNHASAKSGIISAHAKFPKRGVEVQFDDGDCLNINTEYLRAETTTTKEYYGLTYLVEAEEAIAAILLRNEPFELSTEDLCHVQWVLDHADVLGYTRI
jgi:hypothetical protein